MGAHVTPARTDTTMDALQLIVTIVTAFALVGLLGGAFGEDTRPGFGDLDLGDAATAGN
jgi:hypothetical protein